MNKIDELKHCILFHENIDIVCIIETHLNKNVLDCELSIDGYKFFRKDRNFNIHTENPDINDEVSGGGGSIVYFKDNLNVNLVESFYSKAPDSIDFKKL